MRDLSTTDDPAWHWRRLSPAAAALASGSAGLFLAWHHPLWPVALSTTFALWAAASARWPQLWLFALPAALPTLNFSPWTGWLIFDESDLLVLGALGGAFARLALRPASSRRSPPDPVRFECPGAGIPVVLAALAFLGLMRGLADAGTSFNWLDGYADASNTLRVSKSLVYASAFWPLLRVELLRSTDAAVHRFARGMQVGLACVGLALLYERAAYPGLLDFSTRYRTTAAFWEMHVGGAAIDAYLALATPFAAWALWSARSRRSWTAAALLALLTGHACLTTFSRGAYVGVALPLALLGCAWWWSRFRARPQLAALAAAWWLALSIGAAVLMTAGLLAFGYGGTALTLLVLLSLLLALRWRARAMPWRRAATMALTLALMSEAVAVLGGGNFMRSRLDASKSDFAARLAHWAYGVGLLSSPVDWLLGIGAGRLPAHYARHVPNGEFSGSLTLVSEPMNGRAARLSGPPTDADIAGLFALTQRVALHGDGAYRVSLRLRVAKPTEVAVDVCEQHLLYARQCQGTLFQVQPRDGAWQWVSSSLDGPDLSRGAWYAPRSGVFSVSLREAGGLVDIAAASLQAPDHSELLDNREFAAGLAHWFPSAQAHFLPWHIDNLYLELLIERGAIGLVAFLLLLVCAFRNLLSRANRGLGIAPFLAASLLGALLVGTVSSVFDVPRIAFLFVLVVVFSSQLRLTGEAVASDRLSATPRI
jgi:hypothetical protein